MHARGKAALSVAAGIAVGLVVMLGALHGGVEAQIPAYGGHGGRAFAATCPPGRAIVGANVSVARGVVAGVRILCGSLGAPSTDDLPGDYVGGPGGQVHALHCPAGYAAVGFWGGSGAFVDRLSFTCAPGDDPRGPAVHLGPAGGGGGSGFRARCQEGFLLGLQGRVGALVDAVEAVCGVTHDG